MNLSVFFLLFLPSACKYNKLRPSLVPPGVNRGFLINIQSVLLTAYLVDNTTKVKHGNIKQNLNSKMGLGYQRVNI